MARIRKEKSIIGRINDMGHRLVLMLVAPIILSVFMMLFYELQYSSSIMRMETIASLKNVVAVEIPEMNDVRVPFFDLFDHLPGRML